jgi:hypothetical protein
LARCGHYWRLPLPQTIENPIKKWGLPADGRSDGSLGLKSQFNLFPFDQIVDLLETLK